MRPRDARLVATHLAPDGRATPGRGPGERLTIRSADRVTLHDRAAFLSGPAGHAGRALATFDVPAHATYTPTPDGGLLLADSRSVRALAPDGTERWRLPHDPWHDSEGRPPGPPAVSPDGALASVLVPRLVTDDARALLVYDGPPRRRYGPDDLLLLDAATGAVRARHPAPVTSDLTQRWSPDGAVLAVSCWTAWHSWTTHWLTPALPPDPPLPPLAMHEVIDFLPGSHRALTLRRAEYIAQDDDRNELALHDARDGTLLAHRDLGELAADPDNDEFDGAHLLDATHLLLTGHEYGPGHPTAAHHWLLDAATLRPLDRLHYPLPVTNRVLALGDGTWFTHDDALLRRWALSDS